MTTTLERVASALEDVDLVIEEPRDGMTTLRIRQGDVRRVMEALKNDCGFEVPIAVTAVDHEPREPRFDIVWMFLSVRHNDRVRVRCYAAEEWPTVPTITDLWPGTAFLERECYDMFGVRFEGHENLRRLLMPQAYEHHPLRKEFPHRGIEPDKLYREWDEARRKTPEGEPS